MTENQWGLAVQLFTGELSRENFLQAFGAGSDGATVSLRLLQEGLAQHDDRTIEAALTIGFHFGFQSSHLGPLIELVPATWHRVHENIVSALGDLKDPSSVPVLEHCARWIPDYLEFDEFRALAYKSIWALGAIQGTEADAALQRLTNDQDPIVSENARVQVKWRSTTPPERWPYMQVP